MPADLILEKDLLDERKREQRIERIAAIEDEVYQASAAIVLAGLAFAEVDPQAEEPPEEWIALYGLKAARQRLKVAKSGWEPQSTAPSGIKLAQQVMNGINRGRSFRARLGQTQLNVKISLPAPTSSEHPGPEVYEIREIE